MYRYFKRVSGVGSGNYIYFWNSKGLSDKNITAPNTSDYNGTKTRVEFSGNCLRQDKIALNLWKKVSIYIVYEISKSYSIKDYPTLENCLFGAVSLTKSPDIDKYKYSGYGIGFDRHEFFSYPSGGASRNVIIFGVDMSSSTKIDNNKKDILILGKGPTQGLQHTLSAEKNIQFFFLKIKKSFLEFAL